jgi:RNA polymerase sigma-70 factor, ECF subfamily
VNESIDDFDDFFRTELPRLIGFLINAGFGWEESRDAAADAMLSAYQAWAELDYPKAYVRTAAHHVASKQIRRDQERTLRSIQGGWVTPEQVDPFVAVDDALDAVPRLLMLLNLLPHRQRLVFAWHLDGFANTEIAHHLEMSPATVASHLRHAKQRLRTKLHTLDRLPAVLTSEGGIHHDAQRRGDL